MKYLLGGFSVSEEEKAKEYRELIQKKLYPNIVIDANDANIHAVGLKRKNEAHAEEWVCLRCGHIYPSLKGSLDCKCKEIFRRDHDVQI